MGRKIDLSKPMSKQVPMKYWAMGASLSSAEKRAKLDTLVHSHAFLCSVKKDGNWGRVVWEDGECILQSRTTSKKTGEYSDLTDKVLFMDDISKAFEDTTVLLGEIYLTEPTATAREVGTILRCLGPKAIDRQKKAEPLHFYIFDCLVYNGIDLTDAPITERIKYLPQAAAAINSPLVEYAKYYEVNEDTFYDRLTAVFNAGGEGMVLYKKDMRPCQDRTAAWDTVKVKRELEFDVDVFISGTAAGDKEYKGGLLPTWQLWQNSRTGELVRGNYYTEYSQGGCYEPVSKTYFFGLPGSIECSVYDNEGNAKVLCYCSNLTDEFRCALRDHLDDYIGRPARISGMMISEDKNGNISLRHPKFLELRDDIDAADCQLSKLLAH